MGRLSSLITKGRIRFSEKKYSFQEHTIKYLLLPNKKSKALIISFSAFPNPGQRSQYNYVRTLAKITANKLFILDDFGPDGRGAYYLGKKGDFFIERLVDDLIQKIICERSIKRIICLGSSKGGYSALYFGIKHQAEFIIAGAPQFLLGNYLTVNEDHLKYLEYIMGGVSFESIRFLNDYMKNLIILLLVKMI